MRACIAGWGAAVPETRIPNAVLEMRVDTTDAWIVERTGIHERRIATADESTATLAAAAGAAAIKHSGLHPDAIDLLVIATATPEQPVPHTGAFVSDSLGLRCGSFDMNVGCAGFIYALVTAAALLEFGGLAHVLVIGADTLSKVTDPYDRGTCILFADAAAGVVLAPSSDGQPGLLGWDMGCDGSAAGLLAIPAGGSRRPTSPETLAAGEQYIKMQGPEVFRRAVRTVVASASSALAHAGITAADLDWVVPHQANLRIIEAAGTRLGVPLERVVINIDRYGNTSGASIPLAMAEAADDGRFQDGDLILLSGFGAGMSWGSVVLRWGRP